MIPSAVRNITYGQASIGDFNISRFSEGRVEEVEVNGLKAMPTERFWTSLCVNYSTHGLSTKLFRAPKGSSALFTHAEIFQRIHDRLGADGKDRLGFAIEELEDGRRSLLAVRNPKAALIQYEPALALVSEYAVAGVGHLPELDYHRGVIQSTHVPPNMDDVTVGGDAFKLQYVTETPIDGYGKPLNYLMMVRRVCSNGAIGYARAFKQEVPIGKADDNPITALERCLQSYNNEEGYSSLTNRFRAATGSWASIEESYKTWQIIKQVQKSGVLHAPAGATQIAKLSAKRAADRQLGHSTPALSGMEDSVPATEGEFHIDISRAFLELTGDYCTMYELTSTEAITARRRSIMPVKCTVYDLINFVTEIATHYADGREALKLHAHIGSMLSNEYDLENSCTQWPHFQDWFTDIKRSDRLDPNYVPPVVN